MNKNTRWILMILVALVLGCSGGDDDGDGGGDINGPKVTIDDGWNEFTSGNYSEARDVFQSLVASKGEEAHEGIGWCNLRLNNISGASSSFSQASSRVDANAGALFAKWALQDYASVEGLLTTVLNKNTNWVFKYDSSVNVDDLYLHAAYSHMHLGDLSKCVSRIQDLDPSFQPNMNDPNIEKIILDKLEALKETLD